MAGRDLVPATTKNPPLAGEKLPQGTKTTPALTGGASTLTTPLVDHRMHNPVTDHRAHTPVADHSLRPSHELDHVSTKPLSLRPGLAGRGHPMSGERGFFSSDESALNKQIQATHAPDMEDINVRPVLAIIEDILRLARPSAEEHIPTNALATHGAQTHPHLDMSADKVSRGAYHDEKPYQTGYRDEKAYQPSYRDEKAYHSPSYLETEIVKILAFPINKVSCEIVCKSAGGGESHQVTMDLLKSLASYTWDAKIVIAFAAFAINYGEFWLVEHLHTKNPLAKNIATLKDLPDTMAVAGGGELRKQFDAVIDLLTEILKVTHCIIEFKELPPLYINSQSPEITAATAHIPSAVYWSIRGLLVCASTLLNLIGGGHEFMTSTSASWEILNLAHKLKVILDHLQNQMKICKEIIERKKFEDAYIKFKRLLETAHIDNMRVLTELFRFREDQRPLYDGSRRTNEQLTVLKMKYVLLLISDLELPPEELHVLHIIHNERSVRHDYEVLWLPIMAHGSTMTEYDEKKFYDLRNSMPWYSADHPNMVNPVAIRYAREELHFTHRPLLVVLDPHGKLSNHNALPMMWIWGAKAFPFTKDWERKLWEESDWNIELLADHIDPRIQEWINANKVICLYGGDDIVWIRNFTAAARAAARSVGVTLEMLYVGKRNPREKVRQCHDVITRENLSHIFAPEYYDYVWYFWERLASMWNSKKQIGRTVEDDRIMKGILDLLTFDSSEKGWAVFSRGNYEITMGIGEKVLPVVERYAEWAYEVDHPDKFVPVLDKHLSGFHPDHHCHRLILPGQAGYIPETVVCTECGKMMDKFVMYRCCTD
ncbi:protein SIEVE ELEMENT OCCLUSION B-like [Salvia hispanica]|uniref:protein SIEVE ELEMENT OCCLUSION B-like n=1 Tax=Salvia hispanica TaxID=49212 RepID=UPI0020096A68|nr:protein SIEVE ELEMENT OCCLUSION B-like [Salvia hispanica]